VDWDNDGRKDLVLGGYYGNIKVYLNTGTDAAPLFDGFSYVTVNGTTFDCDIYAMPEVVDWNGDGKKDLLCGSNWSSISLLLNTGSDDDPQFSERLVVQESGQGFLSADNEAHPVVWDLDLDGAKDLLAGNRSGEIRFYRNQGADNAPYFDGYQQLLAGGSTIYAGTDSRPEVVDWNNDGDADLIVGEAGGRVRLYLGMTLLKLLMPDSATEGDGILTGQGTVSVAAPVASDLVVDLVSSDVGELSVPATVTILAGNTNVFFDVTIIDDPVLDGSQGVTVTASAPACITERQAIPVHDNETTTLTVTLPASVTEGDGVLAGQGTVTLGAASGGDVLVSFTSSDPSAITANSTIVAAGQASATFELTVIDDNLIDGTQTASITAHVENWTDGVGTVSVLDNEGRTPAFTLPATVGEGDGVIAGAGSVSMPGIVVSNTVVTLASDDTTELTVPATVTIAAGSSWAALVLTAVDDTDKDGRQTVTVTGSAMGYTAGTASVTVADNEVESLSIGSIPAEQTAAVPFAVTITALDVNGEVAWSQGGVSLTATGESGAHSVTPAATGAFTAGIWSGSVAVNAVDSNVRLHADDGNSHQATSGPFSLVPGPFAGLGWAPIPSTCGVNVPIPVTVFAQDAHGHPVSDFTGSVELRGRAGMGSCQIGAGTFSWHFPMATDYRDARTQVIYLQSEIGGAMPITHLALNVTTVPGEVMNNWTIRMKHTAMDSYPASPRWEGTGWTTVYQANQTISSTGWVEFELSTPFNYNGSDNVMIDFSFNKSSYSWSYGQCFSTPVAANRSIFYRGDSSYGDPLSWSGASPVPWEQSLIPDVRLNSGSTFDVMPAVSQRFVAGVWTGLVSVAQAEPNVTLVAEANGFISDSAPFEVVATNSGQQFLLYPSAGPHGAVDQAYQWVPANSNIVITAIPDSSYEFADWSGDTDGCIVSGSQITVPMDRHRSIAAAFFVVPTQPYVGNHTGVMNRQASAATLQGALTAGGVANAWICWGTTDGGTGDTGSWDNVMSVGLVEQGVAFSNIADGLEANMTYWYRCYASNAAGEDWSHEATSFSGTPVDDGSGGGSKLWTPSDITTVLWLDAADMNTIQTSGSSVTNWNDKSGNGHDAVQATPASQPTNGGTIGGLNAIVFDGTSDRLDIAALGINNEHTIYAVAYTVSSSSYREMLRGQGTDEDLHFGQLNGNCSTFYGNNSAWADVGANTPLGASTSAFVNGVVADGAGNATPYHNGTAQNSKSCTMVGTTTGFSVGSVQGANFWDGPIAEIIVCPSAVSSDTREKLEGYLAWKWGVQANLPTDHAYRSAAPGSPVIANLAPTGMASSDATFNASISASDTNYTVDIYWGTSDGFTNTGAWAYSATAGSWTNVSTNISYDATGLQPGTSYYYTFRASNAGGHAWASPSWCFTALSGTTHTVAHAVPYAWLAAQDSGWADDYEAAAALDHDGDGVPTCLEYWCGTDPQDADSQLCIDAITRVGGELVLQWRHAAVDPNIPPIAIEACDNLGIGAWSRVGLNAPTNGTNSWSQTAAPQRYYRLAAPNAQ